MLKIKTLVVGTMSTNCYIITDEQSGESAVIDPGESSRGLDLALSEIPEDKLCYILLTHGHFDHIKNAADIKEKFPAAYIAVGEREKDFISDGSLNLSMMMGVKIKPFKTELLLREGDTINLGSTVIEVLNLPGHTKGGVGYLAEGRLFCGDTLFKGSMGRTDFETGDEDELMNSLKKLSQLPEDTQVYPGHGPMTTIEEEKHKNLYMKRAVKYY